MNNLTDEELLEELKLRFKEKKESLTELRRLTKELKEVNKKLTESESLKSHFISNITNEIINPFTSILGLSKTILEVKRNDWEKVYQMAKLIFTEAFSLDFQLKNIFAAAEIEAGETQPHFLNVDISNLISSIIESFRSIADKKHVEIIFHDEISAKTGKKNFRTDAEKIQLMISNLVDNAIKFSSAANKVEIKAIVDDGNLIVAVKDYGIGISKENQKIIFDRFKRLDTGINSINRGHGLGLSINKAFLDMLDGKIEVNSQRLKGSIFTITIPESTMAVVEGFASEGNEFFFADNEIF
jgi:signal transduction histidine kinase